MKRAFLVLTAIITLSVMAGCGSSKNVENEPNAEQGSDEKDESTEEADAEKEATEASDTASDQSMFSKTDDDADSDEKKDDKSTARVQADDGSFSVTIPTDYRVNWISSDKGMQIFPDEELDSPYIFVYTKSDVDIDPGQWVEEVDWTNILGKMEPDNAEYTPVEDYDIGGYDLKGIEFRYVQNVKSTYPGPEYCLCLARKDGSTIIDYNAYYYPGEKDEIMKVLEDVIKNTELGGGSGTDQTKGEAVSLLDFCNDKELTEWFDSIDDEPPARLVYEYVEYEGDRYDKESSEQDVITSAVKALLTVKIGEKADFDVLDGQYETYTFEMKDGSKKVFTFDNDMFSWNNGKNHVVADYGDLSGVSERMRSSK